MEAFIAMVIAIFGINLSVDKSEILLLDSNKTSAIVVNSKDKTQILQTPNSYIELSNIEAFASDKKVLSQDEVDKKYGNLIRSSIAPAKSYLIYFTDGTELTAKSASKLDEIKQAIKDAAPCEVSVIGHTDTYGSDELNTKVSRQRAQFVASLLSGLKIDKLDVTSFGEKNLLVKTPDEVKEPKNRRVEIQIR
ncbi:OmpA family protein [Campylobacter geochelonis]|uniref:Outer membrane fibronectin-binding protein n=1 Tax=Campylobacter geochelonis TaxID=1780362 RepID=A0A128EMV2_9BACT|nr:OmpA family protein [Campylobacter geochelonis]QKF70493.1 OmpA domain-containing protein [Campylobacter geochelonis]CZE46174.1 outer membrane fibronectin-binding protein [Campylobacter geochelonis]CZE46458.1 outer membrane fibronectin-binding protein [Campylobacter geochelonis]CZE50466.1 outer membrane fibronectin-binding protein [Campylobacter geochelonis]